MAGASIETTLEHWASSLREVKTRTGSLFTREHVADALRASVRDYVVETVAEADAVPVIDEAGFLKQGRASPSVPVMMRHRPSGSLPLRTLKDHRRHAAAEPAVYRRYS